MLKLIPLMLLLAVSSCATVGPSTDCVGQAIRLTNEAIDTLTDAEVTDLLVNNETGYTRGCYVPNR